MNKSQSLILICLKFMNSFQEVTPTWMIYISNKISRWTKIWFVLMKISKLLKKNWTFQGFLLSRIWVKQMPILTKLWCSRITQIALCSRLIRVNNPIIQQVLTLITTQLSRIMIISHLVFLLKNSYKIIWNKQLQEVQLETIWIQIRVVGKLSNMIRVCKLRIGILLSRVKLRLRGVSLHLVNRNWVPIAIPQPDHPYSNHNKLTSSNPSKRCKSTPLICLFSRSK